MKNQFPLLVIVTLAAVGVGFALGWSTKSTNGGPQGDVDGGSPALDSPGEASGLDSPHAREARLISELAEARDEVEALQEERDDLKARVPAEEASAAGEDGAPKTSVTFAYPSTEAALADIDWKVAGVALAKMPSLIAEMLQSVKDGEPKIALQGKIQTLNGPLLTEGIKLMDKEALSGTGVNGLFTHPAVQVNFVASALFEANLPLDERQVEQLEELGDRFLAEEQARVAGYDEHTFALQKVIDEAALRDRFFAAVDSMLTSEQVEALHPEISRGRLRADLFSSGLIWLTVTGPLKHKDRADLAQSLAGTAMRKIDLPADVGDSVAPLAEAFAGSFTDAYLAHVPDALDQKMILHVDRVTVAAQNMLQFLKAVDEQVPMNEDQRKGIRDLVIVLVPLNPDGA